MQARSSVPERNKVRLGSFHTSVNNDYHYHFAKKLYVSVFQKVSEGRCNINEMWLNSSSTKRSFTFGHSPKGLFSWALGISHCVCKRLFGPKGLFLERFVNITRCGWVNVYVCKRLFGPKGSFLLERRSRSGSSPNQRSMLLKDKLLWIHFTMKERTTLLNQYSLFCSIKN